MDKIVDHLFILEVMVWSKISQTILILEPMKTVHVAQKRKQSRRKTGNKTTNWKFDFQRAKEYQKIEKRNQGFRVQKIAIEQLFTDGKVPR
jgi:ATP-binding cassette subfamily F protein uup